MAVAIQSLSCARFVTVGGNRSFPLQRKPLPFYITFSSPSRNLIVTASSKNKNKKKKSSHFTPSSKNKNNTNNNTTNNNTTNTTNSNNNKEKTSYDTKGNDREEDAFEMLFKKLEKVLKTDDLSKDDSGDDHVTEKDIALFERELKGVLGELEGVLGGFDSELLNSDTGETQADNDAEKNSGDRNKNSLFGRELDGMLGEFEGLLGELKGALGEFDAVNSDTSETQVVNDAQKNSGDGNENLPKLRTSKLNKLVRALKTRRGKTSKNLSHVTKGNDEKEDAFEMLFKKLEEALKNDDLSKDDSGHDDITEEEIALFEQKLEGVLGDFGAELLNSDRSETHADNDAEKNSGDGYENSLKLRTLLSSISFSLFGECI